jgi:protein TonB
MPALKNPVADLRSKYPRYLNISLILSLSFLIIAFRFSPHPSEPEFISADSYIPIELTDIPVTVQRPKPPPPPQNPELIEIDISELEEVEFNETELYETDVIEGPPPSQPPPEISKEPEIFIWSEVMPQPIGGLATIQNKVNYTEIAKRIKLEGTVYIEAIIDEKGNVIESKIIKKIGGGLD